MHLASPSRVLLGLLAGKSLKTLMSKGILQVHPPICDCPGCRISSPVVRHEIVGQKGWVSASKVVAMLSGNEHPNLNPADVLEEPEKSK